VRTISRILLPSVTALSFAILSSGPASAGPIINSNAVQTIALPGIAFADDDSNGFIADNVAYNPTFQQYYGGYLGVTNGDSQFAWNSTGALLQSTRDVNVFFDSRSYYFNPNTGNLESVTYDAKDGSAFFHLGLVTVGLDNAGLVKLDYPFILTSMPGLPDTQSSPAFDPARNRFYAYDGSGKVDVVSRVDGSLSSTIALDLASAGNPKLQGGIGYDPTNDLLIMMDYGNNKALIFGIDGSYLGASQLPADFPISGYLGYTNGQLFEFDTRGQDWQGFQILQAGSTAPSVPEPGGFLLAGLGLIGLWVRGAQAQKR
jgi:PEP-CTERM motif